MKKLSLWICPVVLVALATSAHAGTYVSVPVSNNDLETYYAPGAFTRAVSAYAWRPDRNNPAYTTTSDQDADSDSSGLSQKTWVWEPSAPLDAAPSEPMRCTYKIGCTVYATATSSSIYVAKGVADFTFSSDVNESQHYYHTVEQGRTKYNYLPPSSSGLPLTVTTQYSSGATKQPYLSAADNKMHIRAQASVSVTTGAYVMGASDPDRGTGNSGQASIGITDFSCPDQDPGQPPS